MLRWFAHRFCCWGLDGEGDFGLAVGPLVFIFYKYREPVVFWGRKDFAAFENDGVSKNFWRSLHLEP